MFFSVHIFSVLKEVKVKKKLYSALFTAGLFALGSSGVATAEGDIASAEMLSNTCAGCHGTYGASTGPAIPTIAGLSKEYFVEVMKAYQEGTAYSTIMGRIAKGYSEDEIKAMAGYFYDQPFVKAKQSFDEKLVKEGGKIHDKYCEKCHAEGGSSREDDSGIMAGQWTPYLKWTMSDFKDGRREMPKKMKKKVNDMLEKKGDAGLEALLAYYASQK